MTIKKTTRFYLLDGLRGIAAIAVMIYHYTQHNGLHWFGGAWVAVDLFFILSGFVIAHSYGAKILAGLSLRQFTLSRLIRLGPLYFFGLVIGLIAAMLSISSAAPLQITTNQVFTAFSLGLIWIPYINSGDWAFGNEIISGAIFPLNDPAWTLFFEFFVNILFFLILSRYRQISNKKFVAVASIVFILCTVVFRQVNPGWNAENFVFGFPRVIAEFFIGALIYSTRLHLKIFRMDLVFVVSAMSIFCFAFENWKLSLINSMTLIPLTVIFLSTVRVEGITRYSCKVLGDISYPLYILHFPLYRIVFNITDIKSLNATMQTVLVSTICIVFSIILAAADSSARKWITTRLSATVYSVPREPVPVRHWPLFRARELIRDLIESFRREQRP